MKRERPDGPTHEPIIAAIAGIIFLIIGGRHDTGLGLGLTILGTVIIAVGALAFVAQFLLWWRRRGGAR